MRQSACLVNNPIKINHFAALFENGLSITLHDGHEKKRPLILVGMGLSFFICCLAHEGLTDDRHLVVLFDAPGI